MRTKRSMIGAQGNSERSERRFGRSELFVTAAKFRLETPFVFSDKNFGHILLKFCFGEFVLQMVVNQPYVYHGIISVSISYRSSSLLVHYSARGNRCIERTRTNWANLKIWASASQQGLFESGSRAIARSLIIDESELRLFLARSSLLRASRSETDARLLIIDESEARLVLACSS
jgi:hypothetical protein